MLVTQDSPGEVIKGGHDSQHRRLSKQGGGMLVVTHHRKYRFLRLTHKDEVSILLYTVHTDRYVQLLGRRKK